MDPMSHLRQSKVLIVEDCLTTSAIIARAISDIGKVSIAHNAEEGLNLARSLLPDIVLLDIQLGDSSGLDLCNMLKSDPATANIVVIFITASGDEEVEIEAFENGGADFVKKPINHTILRARINTQLSLIRQHQSLEAATRIYNQIISKLPNFVSYWSNDLVNYFHNDEQMQWFDYPDADKPLALSELVSPDVFMLIQKHLQKMRKIGNDNFELTLQNTRNKTKRFVMVSLISDKMYANKSGFVMVMTDITKRRRKELTLQEEKEKYQTALQSIGEGVVATDISANVTYINPIAEQMLGVKANEALGKPVDEVFVVLDALTDEILINPIHYALQEDRVVGVSPETCLESPKYGRIDIDESSSPIRDPQGNMIGAISVFQDVSTARKTEKELAYLTNHEPLTQLPNRVLLMDRAEQALKSAARSKTQTALIVVNIDYFQKVNDMHGYLVGDQVLKEVSKFLSSYIRESDTLSRNSGDEFVLLFPSISDPMKIKDFCSRLLSRFGKKWIIGDLDFNLSVTMGIAISPTDANDAQSLYRRADAAMHEAKRAGRNNYRFYSLEIEEKLAQQYLSANQLRDAITNQEIEVFYQAKVFEDKQHVLGVEALVRWRKSKNEIIYPEAFIGLAEDTRLIIPLGELILRQACTQAKKWLQIQAHLTLAVNISSVQFNPGFIETLTHILEETQFPAEQLEIEVTESVLINDEHAIETFQLLKNLGVKVALDDFGTGYSSLSYVKKFPLDILKIDQSFVLSMLNNQKDSNIVKTIINFAKDLQLEPVAEGVELVEHVDTLRKLGCSVFQGFYFSKPVAANDMQILLEQAREAEGSHFAT